MIIRHYILMRYLGLILLLFVCGTVEAAERSESITGQVLDMGWDTMKEFGGVFGKTVFHLIMWSLLGLVLGGIGGWFLWKHCVIAVGWRFPGGGIAMCDGFGRCSSCLLFR